MASRLLKHADMNDSSTLQSIDSDKLDNVAGGIGPWGMMRMYQTVALANAMANGYAPPVVPVAYYYGGPRFHHFRYWR